ncbi:deazaflavin-dependent oxidoreductase (nitroreductase family) [Tamaricihabitans halophyticus]|uniref:Deazaflavin-dependent oxidoreductase (Nitroreductase family) n=1 Tax=Tamaricihabitans halophyticus TaxID=1262583 RepID=A0A4R2R4Q5_9PSEU|nr:nitroreductase family deazaflavin-dependent oxidoreductase [Tamaricihabitans halophyticus]TCP56759.1 deazaflavin-dependent oxidoreductase (nitroreductase family) [Tamaricihabitans halophyticus]
MEIIDKPDPPTGIGRLLARTPIHLYRAGFGWLLGGRFLRLTHTGRKSGKPREVVIEVVGKVDDGFYVCSGFGERADWYRNVRHNPEVTIQVGRRRGAATAIPLSAAEGGEIMAHYASKHPKIAMRLCRTMGFAVDGGAADFREVGQSVPFLKLARPA